MAKIDIPKENLNCHHLLFIKDVISSKYDSDQSYFYLSSINLTFRKARLNGIVVAQAIKDSDQHFWLDDGTGVIRVIIPMKILNRREGQPIGKSTNLTLFGEVKELDGEIVLKCGGFKVEEDCISEIYHWLKVIQDRPTGQAPIQNNMFYSLSSFPSPNRLLDSNFLKSPVQDIDSKTATYLWSPNHKFATSTPMRIHQQEQIMNHSPLRESSKPIESNHTELLNQVNFDDDFDDDDEFDKMDFSLIESNAINLIANKNKRKRSLNSD